MHLQPISYRTSVLLQTLSALSARSLLIRACQHTAPRFLVSNSWGDVQQQFIQQ